MGSRRRRCRWWSSWGLRQRSFGPVNPQSRSEAGPSTPKCALPLRGPLADWQGSRSSLFAYVLNANVYEPLVQLGSDYGLKPGLAESWRLLEDGKTCRFFLRRGVRFHDGSAFGADDVVWTWGVRQADGRTLPALAGTLHTPGGPTPNSDAVRKVDDLTVDFSPISDNLRIPEQIVHPSAAIETTILKPPTPPAVAPLPGWPGRLRPRLGDSRPE